MVFSSILFLFYFLAPLLLLYIFVPKKYKNLTLFLASLLFYAWGEPRYIALMLFSAIFNYMCGFLIAGKRKKTALIFACIVNIGLLVVFKYADFFISTVNTVIRTNFSFLNLALPIGISFYTFQSLSYCIDLYRGKINLQRNFISFGLYLAFFPQLIAGPIVRYNDIETQLDNHPMKLNMMAEGFYRFCAGLAKKVLIANNLGMLWEVTNNGSGDISLLSAWLGIFAYTMQIYYDFSGYSDMAIGLGRVFGFKFCENFDYPYISKSITEFWRRWHMSLSSWFKEYVYIPLGGSRIKAEDYSCPLKICKHTIDIAGRAKLRVNINILVVWMLTGLWHGASFNFVAWGLYYGILLIIEKKYLLNILKNKPGIIKILYTMVIVMVGWVLFASENFTAAAAYVVDMFNIFDFGFGDSLFRYRLFSYGITIIAAVLGATPYPKNVFMKLTDKKLYWLRLVLSFVALVVCTAYLIDDTYNPFLYFRF